MIQHLYLEFESLTGESSFVLILVVSLSVVVVFLLVGVIIWVVRRRHKEAPADVQETGEVRHNLMPAPCSGSIVSGKHDQPLPSPPPTQWPHLYSGHSGLTFTDNSSQYHGHGHHTNTYEVPHHVTTSTPLYHAGYSSYPTHPPSLASSHSGVQYSNGGGYGQYY